MIYTIPYVLLIVFYGVLALVYQQTTKDSVKNNTIYLSLFTFIIFFGCRGFVCDDWQSYYPAFQKCSIEYVNYNVFKYNIKWSFEPGFTLLMLLCKNIVNDFNFFVFICTCINTTLLYTFFKQRIPNCPLGFLLFISFGGFIMSTNLMRNSIAILIFINALKYLENRQFIPYFILCLLAVTFHISSICYIPMYFILHIRTNKWAYLAIFIVANIIFVLHIPIFLKIANLFLGETGGFLEMKVQSYTEGLNETKTLSIGYFERVMTGILIFCYYSKLQKIRKGNIIFINSFLLYILFAFLLSDFSEISLRMSNLFIFSYWIIWTDLIKCFYIKNNKYLYLAFISIYCVLKMIGTTNMITSQYDNIIFGAKSYEERLYIHNRFSKN